MVGRGYVGGGGSRYSKCLAEVLSELFVLCLCCLGWGRGRYVVDGWQR